MLYLSILLQTQRPPTPTLFPYTTLFRSQTYAYQQPPATVPEQMTEAPAPLSFALERSEEHTSELQSHVNLVCRLLLEKKKYKITTTSPKFYDSHRLFHTDNTPHHHIIHT